MHPRQPNHGCCGSFFQARQRLEESGPSTEPLTDTDAMTVTSRDSPNVHNLPPADPALRSDRGSVLDFFTPLGLLAHVLFLGRTVVGAIAFVAGIGM